MWKILRNLQTNYEPKDALQRRISFESEKSKERREDDQFKTLYLIGFNSLQTIGFIYVLISLAMLYSKFGPASFPIVYDQVGPTVNFLHIMQILEIIHPMIGYTKLQGGPVVPFFQLLGRMFILFMMIDPEPRMQKNPVVPFLFLCWGTIEIIRHLYYVVQLVNKEYPMLTWLRYSAWILLYPMGIFGEASVMVYNLPHFKETMKYSVMLPNSWNVSVNFVMIMKMQICVLVGPIMYMLTSHMYRLRQKKMANFHF